MSQYLLAAAVLLPAMACSGPGDESVDRFDDGAATTPSEAPVETPVEAPTAEGNDPVRDAAETTLASGSVAAYIEILDGDPQDGGERTEIREWDRFGAESKVDIGRGPLALSAAFRDGAAYLTAEAFASDIGEGNWLPLDGEASEVLLDELDAGTIPATIISRLFEGPFTAELLDGLTRAEDVDVLGREVLDGMGTTHYLARIDDRLVGSDSTLTEVWVGDDGLIHEIDFIVSTDAASATRVTITVSEHGNVVADLAPDEDRVTTPQEYAAEQQAAEEAAQGVEDERRAAQNDLGLTQEVIRERAETSIVRDDDWGRTALFEGSGAGEWCWAEEYVADAATEMHRDSGEWAVQCGDFREHDLDGYCVGGEEFLAALDGNPQDNQGVFESLKVMAAAWENGGAGDPLTQQEPIPGGRYLSWLHEDTTTAWELLDADSGMLPIEIGAATAWHRRVIGQLCT